MPNRRFSDVHPESEMKRGGGMAEEVKQAGKKGGDNANFKEGENPNASVPKLPQQKGAE